MESSGASQFGQGNDLPRLAAQPPPVARASAVVAPLASGGRPLMIQIPPPAPRRRTGSRFALVLFTLVLMAASGAGAWMVVRRPAPSSVVATNTLPLETALISAGGQRSLEFEMSTFSDSSVYMTASGRSDAVNQRVLMSMSVSPPNESPTELTMIVDDLAGRVYVDSETAARQGVSAPTAWVMMTAETAGRDGADVGLGLSPTQLLDLARSVGGVRDLGMEEFEGEQVRHYSITLSLDQLLAADPQFGGEARSLGGEVPNELTYHAYVVGNELRRMTVDFEVAGQRATIEVVYRNYDVAAPVDLPDPADVTELVATGT